MKIRENFNLQGKCSDPVSFQGKDIVKISPQKFICEPPAFTDEEEKVIVVVKLGNVAWLPCTPQYGVPTPTIKWVLPVGAIKVSIFENKII